MVDMSSLVLTQIYLEASQKAALQRKAKAKGTKVAEEVRSAVDAYLAGVSAEELELLDAATREAKQHLDVMAAELDRINAKLTSTLSELKKTRARSPVASRSREGA
jgi:hypothetical protein